MQNINIYATIAGWKMDKAGLCPIHISIDIDGKRAAFPAIKKRVKPDDWDNASKRVKSGHPNAAHFNALIAQKIGEYQNSFTKQQLHGLTITKDKAKKILLGSDGNKSFYEFSRNQIDIINYKSATKKNYKGEITKMEKFASTILFSEITYSWLQLYEQYMRATLNNQGNTVWKSLKFINTMLNLAIKAGGIIEKNILKEYGRGKYKQGIPVYLEWAEVQILHDTIKSKHMPENIRLSGYYSLLSYYSGLRFADAVSFDYNKKVIHDAQGDRLLLYTAKTGKIVSIAFTKYIKEVVEYIRDKPIQIENNEFNDHLKIIRGIAGINKDITSHTARHSFAMRCAELGMSIDDVQELLGHEQRKSTMIYFKIKGKRLDEAMSKWE